MILQLQVQHDALLAAAKNVLNFSDIQRKAPDNGGAAMLIQALEELRQAISECEKS